MYVPSPPIFAYPSGTYKACSSGVGLFTMIACTENQVMTMACFFAAFHDDYSSDTLEYAQLDCHHGDFVDTLPTGILVDLDIVR